MERRHIVKAMTAASLSLLSFASVLTVNPLAVQAARIVGDDNASVIAEIQERGGTPSKVRHGENIAQWREEEWRYQRHGGWLRAGTIIPTRISQHRRVVLRRGESHRLRVRVLRDVRGTYSERTVIPKGSTIRGELVPYRAWYRFEAEEVYFPNNRRKDIDAVSVPLYISDRYDGAFGDRPVVSTAAMIILNAILGRRFDPTYPPYLGDVFTRYPRARRELVVVYPKQDIDLRLTRDFVRN
jgi:hypothetical protein